MGRRKQSGRNLNGILLLDKPLGVTSNAALQTVKQLYRARKAGHTGSLDPMANGLLPICFGIATKLSTFLLDADKKYRVTVRLGVTTTTADAEGDVLEEKPLGDVDQAAIEAVLPQFSGPIQQLPPMYSAIKHKGERLYKLARQGIEVERKPREITIYSLQLVEMKLPEFVLDVHCSKGTYVRTLAEDIGKVLGCGAHVSALRRTAVGSYADDNLVDMAMVQDAAASGSFIEMDKLLLPIDSALNHWPAVNLSPDSAFYLRQGQAVMVPNAPTSGWLRLYDKSGLFLGVGQIADDGKVAPKKLITV
ncbi:MAG: tRNA pseudouridine(55) synthase TruB [gamma proteobacterium symbiont of Bathyaustriella thionipta]|nr:tRNA pseudouridine(55) synthase TruB [gamma proteobacterium symbiont of Bathyaustriella thionipta]